MATPASTSPPPRAGDAREPVALLYRDLRAGPNGLSSRGAARRLSRLRAERPRTVDPFPLAGEIVRQVSHPLALLLWAASALAFVAGMVPLGIAIVVVVVLNAGFAFMQERQAERAVEALRRYLPLQATAIRDGTEQDVDATSLVPGDVIVLRRATASRPTPGCSTGASNSISRRSPVSRSPCTARPI